MPNNQIRRGQLALHRDRSVEERELDHLFLAQATALPSRPEPRCAWDDIARGRNPHPAYKAVAHSQRVVRKALEDGRPETMAATIASVAAYWDACKAAALAELPDEAPLSETAMYRTAVRESNEAVAAAFAAAQHPSLRDRVMREAREASAAWDRLTAFLSRPRVARVAR